MNSPRFLWFVRMALLTAWIHFGLLSVCVRCWSQNRKTSVCALISVIGLDSLIVLAVLACMH